MWKRTNWGGRNVDSRITVGNKHGAILSRVTGSVATVNISGVPSEVTLGEYRRFEALIKLSASAHQMIPVQEILDRMGWSIRTDGDRKHLRSFLQRITSIEIAQGRPNLGSVVIGDQTIFMGIWENAMTALDYWSTHELVLSHVPYVIKGSEAAWELNPEGPYPQVLLSPYELDQLKLGHAVYSRGRGFIPQDTEDLQLFNEAPVGSLMNIMINLMQDPLEMTTLQWMDPEAFRQFVLMGIVEKLRTWKV